VAEQLVGQVPRPYLGIRGGNIDVVVAARLNLSVREGVLVTQVASNGPTDQAGIKAGDVITALDGQPTPRLDALQHLLRTRFKVGQRITVTVVRGDDQIELALTLGEFPR